MVCLFFWTHFSSLCASLVLNLGFLDFWFPLLGFGLVLHGFSVLLGALGPY